MSYIVALIMRIFLKKLLLYFKECLKCLESKRLYDGSDLKTIDEMIGA